MALPKEPRQKMINIMYLVLTALLAINISAEILNAFKTIDESLTKTNTAVNASSAQIFNSLKDKMNDPSTRDRATKWTPIAEQVMGQSKSVYDFIEQLKKDLIKEAGGDGTKDSKFKEDDQDAATRIFVKGGKGKQLYQMLDDYKKKVLAADPEIGKAFANSLQVDLSMPKNLTSNKKSWEEAYFYMSPTVGALSMLSKFQNDIKTSENKVVTFCHEQVGKVDIVFDSYAAIVGQTSNYVMPGQSLTINAGVGAYSKAAQPKITIGGSSVSLGQEGFATREITAGGPGTYSVPVRIAYFNQTTGKEEVKEVKVDYTVGTPGGASVALDKMNVLYIGVENPITIASSTGWDKTNVSISGGGGSLSGSTGRYVARVNSVTDDCTITVTADGRPSSFKFRVRTIPEAQAYVGGQPSGSNIAAGAFKAQGGVGAGIKNFPFELQYDVVSYTFTCDTDDDIVTVPAQGASFSGAVKSAINQHVQPGRMVTIDDIRVKGPDGRTTKAPSLVYYIK
jgi:gliding motility-associated protein GldM